MLINFNIERLDKLLFDFYSITGMTISVWDADFNQLSFQPKNMRSFCKLIKESPKGKHRCYLSDKALCMECKKSGKPTTHYCHAGIIDTAVPIKFKEQVMGYIMFGQIKDPAIDNTQKIKSLSKEMKISALELFSAYNDLDVYDKDKIDSAAGILKMATRYLWLSEYIDIGNDTIASKIDDYIKSHMSEPIAIETLCDTFGISKNRLYEIFHTYFRMTVGDYIADVRINEAKKLLSSTDIPISQIAGMVGIKDYNYFTKFFKTRAGVPPLKYRKSFPFNLHDPEF